ncbi:MAG TPA: DUF3667 domain-containing protein [Saprospiraceae bacterium]|nr:DUF3667 domain-containing protein [Saprospiraceae bacterium]
MKVKSKVQFAVKGQECLNCGHEMLHEENYCPECGQQNDQRRMSVRNFLHTMLAGFYSFDSRFFRTIIPLIIKPGKVSKEYIQGKRTYYSNPFQLLLQTAIVFFVVVGLINSIKSFNSMPEENRLQKQQNSADTPGINMNMGMDPFEKIYQEKLDSVFKADQLKIVFQDQNVPKSGKDTLFAQLHTIGIQLEFPEYNHDDYDVDLMEMDSFNIHFLKTTKILENHLKKMNIQYDIDDQYYRDIQKNLTGVLVNLIGFSNINEFIEFAGNNEKLTTKEALDSLHYAYSKRNIFWYQKATDFNKLLYDKEFRHDYVDGIISKTTLALFFLLPVFTLFMTLIYFTSRYNYSENLVVVFNLQTVFFIILLISVLIYNLFDTRYVIVILNLAYFFYVYKSLRNIYRQSRLLTMFKFILLTMFYGFLSIVGFLMVSFLVFLF